MTLPTSGPISIGAIAGEFGGSQPDSISEYYRGGGLVPNTSPNSNIPTSGQVSLSNYYGGQAGSSYLWASYKTVTGTSGVEIITHGVAADSAGNVYVTGYFETSPGSGDYGIYINKFDLAGALQWQRVYSASLQFFNGYGITVDSSGNVIVTGAVDGVIGYYCLGVIKFDSSGNLLWQKKLDQLGQPIGYSVKTDSSDNIYVGGLSAATTTSLTRGLLAKFDSSGNLLSQTEYIQGGAQFNGISLDSSGNVYAVGLSTISGVLQLIVVKYNSSLTLQWQRRIASSIGYGAAVDPSGNIYAVGMNSSKILLVKYDSSGSILWQRYLNQGSSTGYGVATDASGNVYITGGTANGILVAKYNSSGTIQWQRSIQQSFSDGRGICIGASGFIYVSGFATDSNQYGISVIMKDDGSASSGTAFATMAVSGATAATSTLSSVNNNATTSAGGTTYGTTSFSFTSSGTTNTFASVT